jgi:hypothetical protein
LFSASFTRLPARPRPHRYAHGLTKLDDIVRAVHGRAIGQHLMPDGRMMALFASEADFAPVHAALQHKASVHVSARNAPKALTLSGSVAGIEEAFAACTAAGLKSIVVPHIQARWLVCLFARCDVLAELVFILSWDDFRNFIPLTQT